MTKRKSIGIDLAKNVFYLFVLSQAGKPAGKKRLNRNNLLAWLAKQEPCAVAMEACGSAHYWARKISEMGHHVELLPPQHVKGYLRGQKNDYNDARAIAEASQHGAIRSVPIKTIEQQDEHTFLQMRQHVSAERTRLINHVRGLLGEYGVVLPVGSHILREKLPDILEDTDNNLTEFFRQLLRRQQERLKSLDEELAWYDKELKLKSQQDETCLRLMAAPGIGPVVSTAMKAWMVDGSQFKRGRDASAALGLVPRQHSTGGRNVLLGITKRGNRSLRSLVVHGARSVVSRAHNKNDKLSLWINRLVATRGKNKAVVALANKLVRIAWVIIARNETFKTAEQLDGTVRV